MSIEKKSASIIIPTFNGASRISHCLDALMKQRGEAVAEIIVVDDGSSDTTTQVVRRYAGVRLISQANAGPAAARNRGANEAKAKVLLFTDDDCIPAPNWLDAMLEPFADSGVVGVKGAYRTKQKSLIARFVQLDYEDRYRLMAGFDQIDFIDTYSAAFRRDNFLQMGGYDTRFLVACAEDVDLSYRMSAQGWKMKFAPGAIVNHTHPDTLAGYFGKKYKFAFWRVVALRKNPAKAVKDSHTPQIMKLQLLLTPSLLLAVAFDLALRPMIPASALVILAFLCSTSPFALRAAKKDRLAGLLSPALIGLRACAQFFGVVAGVIYSRNRIAPSQSTPGPDSLNTRLAA